MVTIFRAHFHFLPVNPQILRAFLQRAPVRSFALIPDQQHRVFRVRQTLHQMMQNPAAGSHATRGNNDA